MSNFFFYIAPIIISRLLFFRRIDDMIKLTAIIDREIRSLKRCGKHNMYSIHFVLL